MPELTPDIPLKKEKKKKKEKSESLSNQSLRPSKNRKKVKIFILP